MVLRIVFAPALWVAHIHVRLAELVKSQIGHVPKSFHFLMWACGFMNVTLAGAVLSAIQQFAASEQPQHRLEADDAAQLLVMAYMLLCLGIGFWTSARRIKTLYLAECSANSE